MEEIQFVNYILSILAVLLACAALRIGFRQQERHDQEIKDLRDKIRMATEIGQQKKR